MRAAPVALALLLSSTAHAAYNTPAKLPIKVINVLDFGADPTGVLDSTAAFNLAALTGTNSGNPQDGFHPLPCLYAPAGTYKITDAVTLPKLNGCLFGDGRTLTVLNVSSTSFNLAAKAVVYIPPNGGGTGPNLHDFGIMFTQPDTSVRANIVAFPPGIFMQNVGRPTIQNVRIGGGSYCVDARGNTGGAFYDNLECGSLVKGLQLGGPDTIGGGLAGALDGVHIVSYHFWPFPSFNSSATPGLVSIYTDGTNEALEIGRTDWLAIDNAQNYYGGIVLTTSFGQSQDQSTFGNISMDKGWWSQAAGSVLVSNWQQISSPATHAAVVVTGGHLDIVNADMSSTPQTSAGMLNVSGGAVSIKGGTLACGSTVASGQAAASCVIQSGGFLSITDMTMAPWGSPVVWGTNPYVLQTGGCLRFARNIFNNPGSGTGVAFASSSCAWDLFTDNAMNGWTWTPPTSTTLGYFFDADANTTYGPTIGMPSASGPTLTTGQYALWGSATVGAVLQGVGAPGGADVVLKGSAGIAAQVPYATKVLQLNASLNAADLPACSNAYFASQAVVLDAASPAVGATLVGGGSTRADVWCNSVAWTVRSGGGAGYFPNGITSGGISATAFSTPGNTLTLSGSGAPAKMVNFGENLAGTSTATGNTWGQIVSIGAASDNASTLGGFNDLFIAHNAGGANFHGGRTGAFIQMNFNTASALTNANDGVNGYGSVVTSNANQGGVSTGFGVSNFGMGSMFAANPMCDLKSGATWFAQCVGQETDVGAEAGSSVSTLVGEQVVLLANHAVHGANADVLFRLTSQLGASVGVRNAFVIGDYGSQWPVDPNGYLLQAQPGENWNTVPVAAAGGIDLAQVAFTGLGAVGGGFAIRTPGAQIDGAGRLQSGYVLIDGTSGGVTIASTEQTCTGYSIVSGGTGFSSTDLVADAYGNVWSVTASGGAVTALTPKVAGWRVTPPTGTISLTAISRVGSQFGTGLTVTETWAGVSTLTLAANGSGTVKLGTGSDVVQFGTYASTCTVAGYITIKDAGGTTRKLAVCS